MTVHFFFLLLVLNQRDSKNYDGSANPAKSSAAMKYVGKLDTLDLLYIDRYTHTYMHT